MTDRVTTVSDLTGRGPRPGLFQLRVLDRELRRQIAALDARVDEIIMAGEPVTDEDVATVDVLCAAIAEARELLDEARRETASHLQRRLRRRRQPRRWA